MHDLTRLCYLPPVVSEDAMRELTKRETALMVKLMGQLPASLAEWIDRGQPGPYRMPADVADVCAYRVMGVQTARRMARVAPWSVFAPLRPEVQPRRTPLPGDPIPEQWPWDGIEPLFHFPIGTHVRYPEGACRIIRDGGVEVCEIHG